MSDERDYTVSPTAENIISELYSEYMVTIKIRSYIM